MQKESISEEKKCQPMTAVEALCHPFPFWPADKAKRQGVEREWGKKAEEEDESRTTRTRRATKTSRG